jgi:glucose-1-phosphate adenylyltransferase
LNANINKIFVITQFLSSSLHRHILETYRLDSFSRGFIDLLAAEEKPSGKQWYQGPACAVRQNLEYFKNLPVDYFLILSGDQLYNMNFQKMLAFAKATDADLTIASHPLDQNEAKRMGLLKIDKNSKVLDFVEKPKTDELLKRFCIDKQRELFAKHDIFLPPTPSYLGSMGIYVFKRKALLDLLEEDPRSDFGKHLIPTQIVKGKTSAFLYGGYWEDIGTVRSYYQANIGLTKRVPKFNCYDEWNSIYTTPYNLPGPKIYDTQVQSSIICEGSIIEATKIKSSILGVRTVVGKGTEITDSYIIGSDYYAPPLQQKSSPVDRINIGRNCRIKKAIIDKNVTLDDDVQLINKQGLDHFDGKNVFIRDGIIIVTGEAYLPKGFVL